MDQHYVEVQKYSHVLDRSLNKRSSDEYLDLVTSLYQIISGERQATKKFEAEVDALLSHSQQKRKASNLKGKNRLG
jgi:hypothetical protein